MMGLVGLMIATIGVDPQVGNTRFMFGQLWLMDGIDFLVLAVALFGVGEVLASVEQALKPPKVELNIRNLMPTLSRLDREPLRHRARHDDRLLDRRASRRRRDDRLVHRLCRREESVAATRRNSAPA